MDLLLVFCTFPDRDTARQIGTTLVEAQLAACVNLCPTVESIYLWQGQIENAEETLALFKTTAAAYPSLEALLTQLHPYDIPEIVALRPEQDSEAYLRWVVNETTSGKSN